MDFTVCFVTYIDAGQLWDCVLDCFYNPSDVFLFLIQGPAGQAGPQGLVGPQGLQVICHQSFANRYAILLGSYIVLALSILFIDY